ncbi:MAG: hypothetical protein ACQERB_02820 [Promethearchaeati archaeon]
MISNKIKEKKLLFIGGLALLIYSLLEITDCIYIVLIALNLTPNVYMQFGLNITEITYFFENHPIVLLPLFLSFTMMRLFSAVGILKNLLWGLYIGIISLVLTMILTILFIPLGFFEILLCAIILIFLIIGKLENTPIIQR